MSGSRSVRTTETATPPTRWDHGTGIHSSLTLTGASGWSQPPPTRRFTSTNTATASVAPRLSASASQNRHSTDTGVASRGWVDRLCRPDPRCQLLRRLKAVVVHDDRVPTRPLLTI